MIKRSSSEGDSSDPGHVRARLAFQWSGHGLVHCQFVEELDVLGHCTLTTLSAQGELLETNNGISIQNNATMD